MPAKTRKTSLEAWKQAALELDGDKFTLKQPVYVMRGEAEDESRFVLKYWKAVRDPKTNAVIRPGLEMANGKDEKIPATIATDLLTQQEALGQANTAYLLLSEPTPAGAPVARTRFVVGEISAALEWLFDDGVEDEHDAKLEAIANAHSKDPDTMDALSSEAEDYAGLAADHRDALDGLGDFDVALIDEAKALAKELRQRPTTGFEPNPAQREALELRNRIGTLLWQNMSLVRSAAKFVFRHHPEILREAMSTYERKARAERRRAAKKNAAEGKNA